MLRALRDERVAALRAVDLDIAAVAQRELGALVDKLAAGEPYRLTRDELPRRRCSRKLRWPAILRLMLYAPAASQRE